MSNTIHVKGANSQDATAPISTGWHLISAVVDDENVGVDLYCDGASVATDGGGFSSDTYPAGACALQIGGRNGDEVASAQDIAEIVVVRGALGDEDRQKVEGYLAHKWGLQGALPASHHYKAEAPVVPAPEPAQEDKSSAAVLYRKWMPDQAPAWLNGPNGQVWLRSIGELMDGMDDLAHIAALSRFPDHTTKDGLSILGGERGIQRGESESDASYASRIKSAWDSKALSGTPKGILLAVHAVLGIDVAEGDDSAQVKTHDGRTFELDEDGELVVTPARVASSDDASPVRWTCFPDLWHGVQVLVPWGDDRGDVPEEDSDLMKRLQLAVRTWKGGHSWFDGFAFVDEDGAAGSDDMLFDWPLRDIDEMW